MVTVPVANCVDYAISPRGGYLATFEKMQTNADESQYRNYTVWKLDLTNGTAEKKLAFSHKNQASWTPQWTEDDALLARMVTGEVQFHAAGDIDAGTPAPTFRIYADAVANFAISPGSKEPRVAVFAKEAKGRPGSVRIFTLPHVKTPTSQKVFFKADRCQLLWAPTGKHLLAMTQTDMDKTGKSYYGESSLFFLTVDGSFDCRVDLEKGGPIHDITWIPSGGEFVVSHGFMPSTTSLFNLKCEPVYTFACGAKNHVRYNGAGNLLCFGGFGNLPGTIETWRRAGAVGRVGAMQVAGTTTCEWSPDGAHLLTATLTPRLRVDNGLRLWSMTGVQLCHRPYAELYQVEFVPNNPRDFPPPAIEKTPVAGVSPVAARAAATSELKKEAYRPPSLRNRPTSNATSNTTSNATNNATSNVAGNAVLSGKALPPLPAAPASKEAKTVRRLQEKLDAIADIKRKHAAGTSLEPEQLEKMAREPELQRELDAAMAAMAALKM